MGEREPSWTGAVGVVMGTRPEVIKLEPIVAAMHRTTGLRPVIISTGQQQSLLPRTMHELGLTADHTMKQVHGQGLPALVGGTVRGMGDLLRSLELSALVVQGDTATAIGAALAAFYSGLPVVHVEAGLRSGDVCSPFPEEVNRRMITTVATLHLAPTVEARDNLLAECVPPRSIVVTGNTIVDAMHRRYQPTSDEDWISRLAGSGRRIAVLTMHRRETWGPSMRAIVQAAGDVVARRGDTTLVVPAHPNPVVREALRPLLDRADVIVTDALPYGDFLRLLAAAEVVLTDSGGIQEEAPSFGVPVLVLRDHTERPDGLTAGCATLVGTDPVMVRRLLWEVLEHPRRSSGYNPYGDGHASDRCLLAISDLVAAGTRPLVASA